MPQTPGLWTPRFCLGKCLLTAGGGQPDHHKALELFEKAARQDQAGAMFALGALYHGGHDITPDPDLAQHWFREAAERGHPRAQLMIGRYFSRGTAGRTDLAEARRWFKEAESQGVTEAVLELTRLPKEPGAEAREAERERFGRVTDDVTRSSAGTRSNCIRCRGGLCSEQAVRQPSPIGWKGVRC